MSTDDKKDPEKKGEVTTAETKEAVAKTTEAPAEAASSLPAVWIEYITPFATAIGKPVDEVTAGLKELVGEPGEEAVSLLQDITLTPNVDIVTAVGDGVPKAKLTKAIIGLRKQAAAVVSDTPVSTVSLDVLPSIQSDDDWLSALKVGGVLKFNQETVTGTVSAALANRVGLYDLPERIATAMETHAESLEEPVGDEYYKMQQLLAQRNYAEVFSAMPGVDGRFATKGRKKALMSRIDERLWSALSSYNSQLKQWVDSWQQGMANPAAMMGMITSMASGGGAMPPGMMAPPPVDSLRDAADAVINDINYVFAGTGIPVAMALAYDAQQIRKVLENSALPTQVGAANREQMLRTLNVSVSSDYPRLERNLKQYALSVVEFQNVTSGQAELNYIVALFQLGAQIPWDKLGGGHGRSGSGIGGDRARDQL